MSTYPYTDRFPVVRGLPSEGRAPEAIMNELREMANEEDAYWGTGKCSGTMYCGDEDHYAFMNEVFGMYAHMNALQRDMCPSATKFEGEIIAMALDLMNASAVSDTEPVGMVTSGGSSSIMHAMLAYREHARDTRNVTSPNVVMAETAHAAFNKACHLFGIEARVVDIDPATTKIGATQVADQIDANTIAIVGSASNYGYGTIDLIEELSEVALKHGVGLHVDGCLGGFILPWGQRLGYDIPLFDFRVPGVTSISADTHKYGYGFKGTSTLLFRDKALRNSQYFYNTTWTGGKYCSPGMDGSRSNGLLAATWAGMVKVGVDGYMRYAKDIFETAFAMQDIVRSHDELRLIGDPTFCFSFTSDEFNIYHVNDFMRDRGWRFNGQQYPDAIHMAVTRPQTQPGLVDKFATDLADAVAYAKEPQGDAPRTGAIYGSVDGGHSAEVIGFVEAVMADMMDKHQALPPLT